MKLTNRIKHTAGLKVYIAKRGNDDLGKFHYAVLPVYSKCNKLHLFWFGPFFAFIRLPAKYMQFGQR